jgi:hypothetical protein
MARIQPHRRIDWCHLCGQRSHQNVDVWHRAPAAQPSAEQATPEQHAAGFCAPETAYIRLCADCARALLDAATGTERGPIIRPTPRTRRRRAKEPQADRRKPSAGPSR